MPKLDWILIIGAAVAAVGTLEWVKGFFADAAGKQRLPSWAWRLILAVVCAGVAVSMDGGLYQTLLDGFALLAVAQVCYPLLVQLPEAALKAWRKRVEG